MKKRFLVFGTEYEVLKFESLVTLMDVMNDDENECIECITKKVYEKDLGEGVTVKYRYVVLGLRGEEGYGQYILYLVPEFECLHEKHRERVLKDCGGGPVTPIDVYYSSMHILCTYSESKKMDKLSLAEVENIANTLDLEDRLFFARRMDAPVNRIGTTGWMELDDLLLGKDALEATLNIKS